MAAKTIFGYCTILVRKRWGRFIYLFIYLFIASKEVYPIVRQSEKITVKKAQAKVVKWSKNKFWVSRNPLGHLSAKRNQINLEVEK